jgi:hypothetical protein
VRLDARKGDARLAEYPAQSLEEWHRAHELLGGPKRRRTGAK